MIDFYRDEKVVGKSVSVDMISDNLDTAVGDGVTRELFSLFWEEFLSVGGGSSHIPLPIRPKTDDYVALGRILHHGYILTGYFPTRIAKACMLQAICNEASEDCIVQSFVNTLPPKQKEIVCQALGSSSYDTFPMDDICDILEDHGSARLPSFGNLHAIIQEISAVELLSKPYLCLSKLKEGMGPFWNVVTPEQVHSIYQMCQPSAKRVIECLILDPKTKKEEKIGRWLKMYLKECTEKIIRRFVWFCTGTDMIVPGRSIKVCFESMPEEMQRPKAKTCFCILILPTCYPSYSKLHSNMDMYLGNIQLWDMFDY